MKIKKVELAVNHSDIAAVLKKVKSEYVNKAGEELSTYAAKLLRGAADDSAKTAAQYSVLLDRQEQELVTGTAASRLIDKEDEKRTEGWERRKRQHAATLAQSVKNSNDLDKKIKKIKNDLNSRTKVRNKAWQDELKACLKKYK